MHKLPIAKHHIPAGAVTFKEGDAKTLLRMSGEFFVPDPVGGDLLSEMPSKKSIEATRRYWQFLMREGDRLLVAELGEHIVGRVFINLRDRQSADSQIKADLPTGIIERLKTIIEHCGIGQALIKNAESIIAAEGLAASEIGVHKDNQRAKRIYEQAGYMVLLNDYEERLPSFEGGYTARYAYPSYVLFKEL